MSASGNLRGIIVALDGPAGSGKSTAARSLAEAEGYAYINTGAMYRAAAHLVEEGGIDAETNPAAAVKIAQDMRFEYREENGEPKYYVAPRDGAPLQDLTAVLFTAALTAKLKPVVNNETLRHLLVEKMRAAANEAIAHGAKGVVLEGRDIGTVVFPDAAVKFYVEADLEERTRRRAEQLKQAGDTVEAEGLKKQLAKRDQVDSSRAVGPLKKAADAIQIDTTALDPQGVLDVLRKELARKLKK